ncbi:hypothetical protein AVEN_205518-1 [Araneus ventricosus]|uniref:Uncharacterized protein n=1 Tax=Araneus ventricosus TaxID=182803 RepID=A0A4Y1ZL95_ARAVE|nr:hypothetical protein AVEN_223413-1 [Araneus ventricosus]GBL55724.1 hypothetical protein AVEN_205518-1 [Araneus ventricosus]
MPFITNFEKTANNGNVSPTHKERRNIKGEIKLIFSCQVPDFSFYVFRKRELRHNVQTGKCFGEGAAVHYSISSHPLHLICLPSLEMDVGFFRLLKRYWSDEWLGQPPLMDRHSQSMGTDPGGLWCKSWEEPWLEINFSWLLV